MANADAYMGFQPMGHVYNSRISTRKFEIASGYAVNIFTGDTVVLTTGKLAIGAVNSAVLLGVFAGCQFLDASGVPGARFSPYWPASTVTTGAVAAIAHVWCDPGIIYRCQSDTTTAYVDATHLMTYADCILTHAGSTLTGISGMELDLAAESDAQFQVLGLIDEPGNAVGVNAKLAVRLRKSMFATN